MKEKGADEVVVHPTGPVGEAVGLVVAEERRSGARGLRRMAALPPYLVLQPNERPSANFRTLPTLR